MSGCCYPLFSAQKAHCVILHKTSPLQSHSMLLELILCQIDVRGTYYDTTATEWFPVCYTLSIGLVDNLAILIVQQLVTERVLGRAHHGRLRYVFNKNTKTETFQIWWRFLAILLKIYTIRRIKQNGR